MKFSCSRDELQLALNITRHAVKDKTPMSILSGILFNVYNHKLHLTATDLSIGITTDIDVDSQEDGAIVLDANLIFNIITRLSGSVVYFNSEEHDYIHIESNVSEYNIAGLPADEFPEFPKPDTDLNFTVDSKELADLINKTRFAAATSETQMPVITGIKMEYNKDNLKLIAIDGFRVAIRKEGMEGASEEEEVAIVAAKNLAELSSLLGNVSGEVTVNLSKSQIFFQIGNTIFTSRLIEGTFFDYASILPKDITTSFEVDRKELLQCCERASLMSNEKENTLIRFDITSGKLDLSSKNDIGNFNDFINIETEGDNLTIAFNTGFLLDALKVIEDGTIRMEFNGSVGPLNIIPVEGDKYDYLILPVRISE